MIGLINLVFNQIERNIVMYLNKTSWNRRYDFCSRDLDALNSCVTYVATSLPSGPDFEDCFIRFFTDKPK